MASHRPVVSKLADCHHPQHSCESVDSRRHLLRTQCPREYVNPMEGSPTKEMGGHSTLYRAPCSRSNRPRLAFNLRDAAFDAFHDINDFRCTYRDRGLDILTTNTAAVR